VCGSVRARLSATLGLAGSVSVAIVCAGGASGRTACSSLGFDSMTEGIWWWPGCDHSSATTGSSATTMRLRVCVDIPSITPMAPCRLHAPLCRGHSYKAQGRPAAAAPAGCGLRLPACLLSAAPMGRSLGLTIKGVIPKIYFPLCFSTRSRWGEPHD
jgi:hypothetical protein